MNRIFILGLFLCSACNGSGAWEDCTADRDLWERCSDGEVIWCHAVGVPHFHSGAKCALANLECTELSENRAACTDGTACSEGEFRCDGNTAVNCAFGSLTLEPCGTRKMCLADQQVGVATCWDDRPEAPCSGHGNLYEAGCVCDRGYTPGPDAQTCGPS